MLRGARRLVFLAPSTKAKGRVYRGVLVYFAFQNFQTNSRSILLHSTHQPISEKIFNSEPDCSHCRRCRVGFFLHQRQQKLRL
ncbi:hypothetical protein ACFX1R_011551 [Malus domestica]